MALYARHPRFTVTLLILIFISLVMFAGDSAPLSSMAFRKSRDAVLAEALALDEMYYQEMVQRRQQLIKKWGPTPDKVDP